MSKTTSFSGPNDPYISFGRCYFDNTGQEAPDRFIPCGNVNFGHVACCESQDMCLSSNACYNGQYGVTYIAGCTDKAYVDNACPDKGVYNDDAWVGLSYCNGTSNQWFACDANRGVNTVTSAKPCWCPTTSKTVAFTDASRLANIVSLGTATGESIDWQGGFLPVTSTPTTSSSTEASDPSPTITSSAQTTNSVTTPIATSIGSASQDGTDGTADGLSIGAKIGAGVGTGLGVAAILVLISALIRQRRRRKEREVDSNDNLRGPAQPVALYNNEHTHDGDLHSPCWSGHKSELDAIGTVASPSPRQSEFGSIKSEVEGSPAVGSSGRPMKDGGYEMPGKLGTVYEMQA